jgi:hypothetical protein
MRARLGCETLPMTLATPLIRDPRNALEPTLHAPAQEVKS